MPCAPERTVDANVCIWEARKHGRMTEIGRNADAPARGRRTAAFAYRFYVQVVSFLSSKQSYKHNSSERIEAPWNRGGYGRRGRPQHRYFAPKVQSEPKAPVLKAS